MRSKIARQIRELTIGETFVRFPMGYLMEDFVSDVVFERIGPNGAGGAEVWASMQEKLGFYEGAVLGDRRRQWEMGVWPI